MQRLLHIVLGLCLTITCGCTVKPGAQKYGGIRDVDTTGMTEEQAAEVREQAERRAQQEKARDDFERMQQNLRDVQRANRGY